MTPPTHGTAVVRALARADGPRLLTHPIFVAGAVIALAGSAFFVSAAIGRPFTTWDEEGWTVWVGFALFGVLTMVATNRAALRDRREHTEEQHRALPVRPDTRTGGLIAAVLWPTTATGVLLVAVVVLASTQGLTLDTTASVALVERVVAVFMLGAMGIAIAAWVPNPFVAPLVAWAFVFVTPGDPPHAWHSLAPLATPTSDLDVAVAHLIYVLVLGAVFAVAAIARRRSFRSMLVPALISVSILVACAVFMLMRACPDVCRL